jgi:hypothetical protein
MALLNNSLLIVNHHLFTKFAMERDGNQVTTLMHEKHGGDNPNLFPGRTDGFNTR